jgi:hypothetical protein
MILRQRWFLDATVPSKEQLHPASAYNASFWETSSEEEPFNLMNGQRGNFVTLYPLLRKKVCSRLQDSWHHYRPQRILTHGTMSMSYRGCPFWESFLKDLKLRDSVFFLRGKADSLCLFGNFLLHSHSELSSEIAVIRLWLLNAQRTLLKAECVYGAFVYGFICI